MQGAKCRSTNSQRRCGLPSKPIRYFYLEPKKPLGKYVNNLQPSVGGHRDIELVAGTSAVICHLESLVGRKVTVQGELPFVFDANAPKVVLPLVMSVKHVEATPGF